MKNVIQWFLLIMLLLPLSARAQTGGGAAPASFTATVGQEVTVAVTVDGTAPFTYQWFKNGTALTAPAAKLAPYIIPNVQLADAGTYKVVVANSAGSTTSNDGVLTVKAALPVITSGPTFSAK